VKFQLFTFFIFLFSSALQFNCSATRPGEQARSTTPDLSAGQVINLFQPESVEDSLVVTLNQFATRLDLCKALAGIQGEQAPFAELEIKDQGLTPDERKIISQMVIPDVMEIYPDHSFKPGNFITRAGFAFYLYRFLNTNPDFRSDSAFTSEFQDVGRYTMVSPAVKFCTQHKLLIPVGEDKFGAAMLVSSDELEDVLKKVRLIYHSNRNDVPSNTPGLGK